MANERVVPIFPCASLKTTLEFYTALGFKILYEQHAPYVYGSVALEGIQLDFIGSKTLKANQETSHICLIAVTELDALHARFSSGIKAMFGKQLRSGIPRMGSVNIVRNDDRRFNLLDPSGNRLIVVQSSSSPSKLLRKTPLARAIVKARLLAHSRDDPAMAARGLDQAIERAGAEVVVLQFQAFVLRAEIAAMLEDHATLEKYLEAAKNLMLEDVDLLEVSEEMARLRELEHEDLIKVNP
jgi:catechol 2,3-dioxygenase-like lactoylglutathione lyase family enzyme